MKESPAGTGVVLELLGFFRGITDYRRSLNHKKGLPSPGISHLDREYG